MIILKNFSVFKNKPDDNEKAPTHRLSAKLGEEYISVGSAWTKETKSGDKFLSAQLSNAFVDNVDKSKSRKEVIMCFAEDIRELCKLASVEYPVETTFTKPTSHGEAI